MKKVLLTIGSLAALLAGTSSASAQVINGFYDQPYKTRNNGTFSSKTSLWSFGIGAPYGYVNYRATLPALYAKYEMGIMDEIGVGLIAGASLGKHRITDDAYFSTLAGAAAYYHFNKIIPVRNLDVYAGLGLGFNIHNRVNDTRVDLRALVPVGVRYYFSEGFAVYAETGYDYLGAGNLGITLRF